VVVIFVSWKFWVVTLVFLGSYALFFFLFVLFGQSFSWDHVDFFFLTKTEKKLTFEISALKTDLDLYRFEMEVERQTHQREEKTLRAQVIEVEERRKATIQEALEKVEALKRECDSIMSSLVLCPSFLLLAPFYLIFFYYLVQPFKKTSKCF
jgi:hypothetical protein